MKLNIGCGSVQPEGWVNADRDTDLFDPDPINAKTTPEPQPGLWFADLCSRLPWPDETFDIIVANHVLSDLDYHELPGALAELHRVLEVDGVLRILVPSLDAAINHRNDPSWFPMDFDVLGEARLCAFITWFGTVKSVFTPAYLHDLLDTAGFAGIRMPRSGHSELRPGSSTIASLDDREDQALIVEVLKGSSEGRF